MQKNFKKILVTAILAFTINLDLNAQSTSLVPNLTATDYGHGGLQIVVGNTLYFGYLKEFFYRTQLAKYDGNTLTVIPNLTLADIGVNSNFTAVGNTIYFKYLNAAGKGQLAKYDGTTLTVIPNPSSVDYGYDDIAPTAIGSNIYFRYRNATNKYQLAKYEGNNLTLIPNISVDDYGYDNQVSDGVNTTAIAIGGTFYFKYLNSLGKSHLAKYDGSTLTVIPNATTTDVGYQCGPSYKPIAIGNTVFFKYVSGNGGVAGIKNLAKYDGNTNTLTVIPNASTSDVGYIDKPIAIGNILYFRYESTSGQFYRQLAKYDGTTLTVIPNVSATDYGYNDEYMTKLDPVAIGTNLYFRYKNAVGKYLLAKYDGINLTVIPNASTADLGCNDFFTSVGSTFYCQYRNGASKFQLAKYDGSNLTLVANPSTTAEGYRDRPYVFGNNLYFRYINDLGKYQLAKYDGSSLSLAPNAYPNDLGYSSEKMIVIGNNAYFGYTGDLNVGGSTNLAKYNGNALLVLQNPSPITPPSITPGFDWSSPLNAIGNTVYYKHRTNQDIYQLAKYTDVTLTLNLTSFRATKSINNTILNWQTINEVNVSHFSIQRSTDGVSFATLGQVNAKGGGNYTFNDAQLPNSSKLFYRLQIIDKDGSFTYSPIAIVNLSNKGKITLSPNPASNYITVSGNGIKMVQVFDNAGKVILTSNTIGVSSTLLPIHLLSKGLYQLKTLKTNGEIEIQKFIKE